MSDQKTHGIEARVAHKLSAIAGLIRNYVIFEAVLWIALWCMAVFWLGGMLDYLPVTAGASETPRAVRIGLLAMMAIGTGWILVARLASRVFARLPEKSLALLVERKYPEFNNELVTAVELSNKAEADVSNPVAYRAMLGRVHESVGRRIESVEPATLLNWQPIWGAGIAFGFIMVVTGIAALGMSNWMLQWSQRLFALSDKPWPRRASLNADGIQLQLPAFTGQLVAERVMIPFENGLARLPNGAAAQLQISADTKAAALPETCTLFYRAEDGSRGRANLRRVGGPVAGWQQFTLEGPPLDGLTSDLEFDVVGLDARLRDHKLQVVEPTAISDMQIECRYPVYLIDSLTSRPNLERLPYRSGQRIPQGTEVTLLGKSSSPLKQVQYVVRGTSTGAGGEGGLQILTAEPKGSEFQVPLGQLNSNLVVEVRLIDHYGLSADQISRYLLTMQEDTVPEVATRLDGIGMAITPNAVIPILGTVTDDHGIQEVAVELARNEDNPLKLQVPIKGDDNLDIKIDLAQLAEGGKFVLAPKMTLGLVVSARDRYDLQGQQHIGLGQPQQLAIVTANELGIILDRQELELRQRLELIISEVEQLREALQQTAASLSPSGSARLPRVDRSSVLVTAQEGTNADAKNAQTPPDAAAQLRRIAALRAQQAVLQGDKSQQELASIALRVDNVRKQLINNRTDTIDRQVRLQEKVHQPLTGLLANEYEKMRSQLLTFQTAAMSDAGGGTQARSAVEGTDQVLIALEAIKANMLDMESFTEILDLVQGLLDDQEKILSETEKQQKQRILDQFKK
jgi:hypothetical protein